MHPHKTELIGLTRQDLEGFARALDQPAYRGRQLFHWLYAKRAQSFEQMTDLPASLRAKLSEQAMIGGLKVARASRVTSDGSRKFLFELADGLRVETVHLPESPGETVCISSQVGCAMRCAFCATGRMGLFRNLTAGEIVLQVMAVERLTGRKVTNVVYMGMGEPLHNYEHVRRSLEILTDPEGLAVSPARVTVSTVGIVPMIDRWSTDRPPAKLAISLHATTDEARHRIVPLNQAYPLAAVMKAVRRLAHSVRFPVTFEYIMIAGLNDRREDAANLRELLRNVPAKVNLIRLHPTGSGLEPSSDEQIHRFMGWLTEEGITCTLRASRGVEDSAACGMLYTKEPFRPSKAKAWLDTKNNCP